MIAGVEVNQAFRRRFQVRITDVVMVGERVEGLKILQGSACR